MSLLIGPSHDGTWLFLEEKTRYYRVIYSVSFFPPKHYLVGDLTELRLSPPKGFDGVVYWHDK